MKDSGQQKLAVCKQGYLKKEGGSYKNWKKRWCVLHNNGTLFYHIRQNGKLQGKISLKFCEDIKPIEYRKKKNCFEVQTPERAWHIIANSEKDMNDWIQELRRVRDFCKGVNEDVQLSANSSSANGKQGKAESRENGKIGENSFEKLKVIGRGSFGRVLKVRKIDTGEIYAMKVLNKQMIVSRGEEVHTKAEKSILSKLNNPFLVHLHFSFQTPSQLFFIMDFVNGGELFYHLQKEKKFGEKRACFYAAEILEGLSYLHKMGIIYRDLKPENLLLTATGHICMTDFGISKEGLICSDDRTATFCGTPEYLAPEVLLGGSYGKEVDWWSFGTLVFEMLTGLPPFYSEDVQLMYSKILTGEINFPKRMSPKAKNLIFAVSSFKYINNYN